MRFIEKRTPGQTFELNRRAQRSQRVTSSVGASRWWDAMGYRDLAPTEHEFFESFVAFSSKFLRGLLFLLAGTHQTARSPIC